MVRVCDVVHRRMRREPRAVCKRSAIFSPWRHITQRRAAGTRHVINRNRMLSGAGGDDVLSGRAPHCTHLQQAHKIRSASYTCAELRRCVVVARLATPSRVHHITAHASAAQISSSPLTRGSSVSVSPRCTAGRITPDRHTSHACMYASPHLLPQAMPRHRTLIT